MERNEASDERRPPDAPPAADEAVAPQSRPAAGDELATRSPASGEALRELALALRTSVEAMHGARELQAELIRSLQRQDRSELVLQSTQALNDTFRNLATIQRELLNRLDAGPPRPTGSRLVPLMLLTLLVVFLGGIYLVVDIVDQMRLDRTGGAALASETDGSSLTAYREGKEEGVAEAEDRLLQLQEELGQMEERERALRGRIDEESESTRAFEAQVRSLESERESLLGQIRAAQDEVLARRAVEDELRQVATRLAVAEPRLTELEASLASERSENARLRGRLAALGLGLPDPEANAPAPAPGSGRPPPTVRGGPEGAGPAPAAAAATSPATPAARLPRPGGRVDRDAQLLEKVRARLNQMLDASSRGRGDLWQVTRIAGVTPDRLDGVIALHYDRRTGRLLEQVEAREARFWVDRNQRTVELELRDGRLARGGASTALPGGAVRQVVADGEMTRLWSQSGLLFLQFR